MQSLPLRPAALVVLAASLLAAAAPTDAAPASRTVISDAGAQRLAWFICDATDGPMVAVVGTRATPTTVPIRLFLKRRGASTTEAYDIGAEHAEAGGMSFPLTQGGRPAGALHMVAPQLLDDPLTPTFTSIDFADKGRVTCRWAPGVRVLAFDARRSVQVRRTPRGLLYESFDFDKPGRPLVSGGTRSSTPSLSIEGGRETSTARGGSRFAFAHAGFAYLVDVPGDRPSVPARLTVSRGARVIQSTPFTAYTFSPSRNAAASPTHARVSPPAQGVWTSAIVWRGRGQPECPGAFDSPETADCLVAFMRRGGASDLALAFSRRMARGGHIGWADRYTRAGRIGVAHVVLPLMANTNEMTLLLPPVGDPVRPDDRDPTPADKRLAGYAAVLRAHPDAFPVGASEFDRSYAPQPGRQRIVMRQTLATCHACKPLATLRTAFDFGPDGAFAGAHVLSVG